ncbi:class I SAM-dependent methyltransferase [Alkalicella caledoniensis]|uniref:Class I SAM-dependent methyltransferase n=1 Tax=Alkalicella caledoniensis TaxID=2731377 RepID=A0A7G9WC48_ALKCA|nr:class I SAM-dependent methyltransferase [Alkalicella caledoniensis]QNO16260.1 class I SAM-dependent methyltransferase [Alkalicella caledoniensis]
MDFYSRFSQYYDLIFPPQKAQGKFLSKYYNDHKCVLDIACGTGSYTKEIARNSHVEVIGIDLDSDMIIKAREKSKDLGNIRFLELNMLDIDKLEKKFDLIYCIGNSLPHLKPYEIKEALKMIYNTLNSKGNLVIQTVNYDRRPEKLPTIINEEHNITFTRDYSYSGQSVEFCTVLQGQDFKVEGKVSLYPIRSTELIQWLKEIGFVNIQLFGDFNEGEYKPTESTSLVVVASR